MKLHLPKGLRNAVMACMAALTTLSTTVGTGIIAGGAVTYVMVTSEAEAHNDWGNPAGSYFIDNPAQHSVVDATQQADTINIYADVADLDASIGTLKVKDNGTFKITSNWWDPHHVFDSLLIEKVEVTDGGACNIINQTDQGNAAVKDKTIALTISEVSGTIASVTNAGTLTLGSNQIASSVYVSGAINNTGTLSLRGTLVNAGSLALSGTIEISKEWGALAGYSEGANGYIGYAGGEITVIQGGYSGDVTFVRDGETVTLTEGKLQVDAYTDSTVYYLNSGTGTATKTADFTPTGVVVQESGSAIELVGLKDADLTDKVAVNVNSTLVIGDGSDLTDAVVQKGCDTLSLTVNQGGKFTINSGDKASTPYNGDITVNGGGTLLLNTVDTLGWGNFGGTIPSSINLKGSDGSLAKLQMTARTTMSSPINMQGYAVIENPTGAELAQHAGLDGYQFTVKATGTNNVISCPVMGTAYEGDVIVNVEGEGDTLEITGKIYKRGGVIDFTKQGAGTLLLSNAESVVDGMFTMEGGVTQVTKNLKLSGGLTMLATAGATIDASATVTVSGGTITLAAANNFGAGTLHFENIITLDVSAFADFDPTVAGSQLTLGQVGKLTMADNVSLFLSTAIDTSLTPVISLDDSGNIVLTIQKKALSWNTTETAAILNTNGLSVTVNYQDGQYVAVYEGGTAVSTPIADGTGQIQVMPTKVMLSDSATISLESGTYAGVAFMQVDGDLHGTLGSATDQKKLTLNITGDASVTNFIGGGQGVLGWCDNADVSLYSDIEFNVNTTGTVAGIVLTGEDNSGSKIKVYGDITANIEAGTIKAVMHEGNVYDSNTGAALAAGSKGMYIEGDITYNLGKVGNDDSALVIEGNVVGTISQMNGGAKGASVGDVVINVNSGTYQSIYGTGNTIAHTGNVTINYNGGIINGVFKASAGATVSGDKVLNMAASLDASKVDLSTFTAVNVLGESVLSVTTGGYAYDSQKVVFDSTATLFVDETGGVVCADQLVVGGNLTINGTVDVTGTVDAEGAKYSDNNTDGYLVSQKALVSAAGNLVIGDNAVFSFNGSAVEDYTVADGTITGSVTDKSVFYVNSADYVYSATKIDSASGIQIAETGSLIVDSTGNQLSAITGEGTLVVAPGKEATLSEIIGSASIGCAVVAVSGKDTKLVSVGTALNNVDVTITNKAELNADGLNWGQTDKVITISDGGKLVRTEGDDMFGWDSAQNLHIHTGGTFDLGSSRATMDAIDVINLNNGILKGTCTDNRGAMDFHKGGLITACNGSEISAPLGVRASQTLVLDVTSDASDGTAGLTLNGEIKNAGALVKSGKGTMVLNGSFSHTGGTTIQEGTLALGGTASFGATTVTINTGAILALGTSAMTMADATLALQNGSILSLAALSADTTPLTLKEVQLGGSVYIDAKAEDLVPGTYNILAGTGLDISKFALYGAAAGKYSTIFSVDENNVLKMTLGLNDKALVWTGDTEDNVWNGTAENTPWEKLDGTVSAFADKNVVNFTTDTPVEERTVTIADTVAPAAAYVYGTDWEWTGAGAINCSGALTVGDGSETELTIANTGAKTFTGGVIVNEGATLVVENADGWTGKVSGAGTLELSGVWTDGQSTHVAIMNIVNVDNGALSTVKFTNGTTLGQESAGDNLKWLQALTVLDIAEGAAYAFNPNSATFNLNDLTIKIAGSGSETLDETKWGGALNLLTHENYVGKENKSITLNIKSLELTGDATINVGKGKDANYSAVTLSAETVSNGNTLTVIGGGKLTLVNKFTDAFDLNIVEGLVNFDGFSSGTKCGGSGTVTIGSGATLRAVYKAELTNLTMQEGAVFIVEDALNKGTLQTPTQVQQIGTMSMAAGASMSLCQTKVTIEELTMSGGSLIKVGEKQGAKAESESLLDIASLTVTDADANAAVIAIYKPVTDTPITISKVTGSGIIELTRDGESRGYTQMVVLDGANEFSGNWRVAMFNTLKVTHEDALANATVELNYRSSDVNHQEREAMLQLGCETVKLKGLQGSIGTVDAGAVTSCELQFNTAGGDYSYGGNFDVSNKVNIVKNGAGSQSFTNTTNFAGNITVNEGTLNLSTAQSSAGREISIAGGATLGTALTLNGGTLSLDTTGATAASLGDNSLTLTVGTMLNLTVLGTEVTGTQITLLGGISEMKNVIVGENGSLGLLGDSFTLGVITDKSVSVDTPAVADAGAVDAWADRLGRSELFYDEENGLLYLSLASNILAADPLYWDPANAAGNGSWLGNNWSEEDKLGVDPGVMQNPWQGDKPVSVVFDGDTAAEVTIDTDAVVTDLTVKNGAYTYVKDGETGTLTIEGKLTVEGTGTADISAMGAVEAGSLDVAGTLTADDLTVNGAAAVTGSVTADELTITGAATVDGGTVGASSLGAGSLTASNGATVNATDIVIGGKAEIAGSTVDATGLLSAAGVVISGEAAVVKAAQLKVGEGGLSMSAGTLNAGQLFSSDEVTAKAVITGGTVTIGKSTLSSTTVTGAEFVGISKLEGTADKAVTVGDSTLDGATDKAVTVTVGNVTVDGEGELTLSNATLTGKITVEDGGTLKFGGTMHLDTTEDKFDYDDTKTRYTATAAEGDTLDKGDGFKIENVVYTVVTGSLDKDKVTSTATEWTVGADKDKRWGTYADGKVTVSEPKDTTEYWVNNNVTLSTVSGNFVKEPTTMKVTTTIKLNGGTLQMDEATALTIETNNVDTDDTDSTIALQSGATLKSEQLTIAGDTTVTLTGHAGTTFDLGSDAGVDSNKLKGLDKDTWKGTVTTAATDITNVAALGNAASEVELTGAVNSGVVSLGNVGTVHATDSLTAESISGTGALEVDGLATLKKGASILGNAAFNGGLVLGGDEAAALTGTDLTAASIKAETLTVGAGITLEAGSSIEAGSLTLGEEASIGFKKIGEAPVVSVDSLTADTLQVLIDSKLMAEAADKQTDKSQPIATIMEVTEPSENMPEITLNGDSNVINPPGEKYGYTLKWVDKDVSARGVAATMSPSLLQLMATANQNYMKEKFSGASANAKAGATIMDEAFASGATNADGDLKKILAAVDAGNGVMTEEGMAAVAGSSTAALGMAFAGDVDRQLRAIRNRTTTMGVNQCVVNEGMPYFNAWVNAEGNMGELDKDGTFAGYQLDSWGGTIGFDVDVNPNLTLGLAVTAMYGDLTVDGPDKLDGDLDTMYVSAFARYSARAWTHTFVGTVGKMDSSYKRTVSYGQGESYKTEGDTDGMAFGLMYEVGRVIALTESGSACLQPVFNVAYRHTTAGGYTEKGGDAALKVDDQTLDTVTLGAGARLQAVVGENLYNRTSLLELRALAKVDLGDRASEADVAFIGGAGKATVESAELGAFGVELGAGLSVPMGDEDSGTLFFDVSAELRSGYTNLNGTVGYRINF